MEETKRRAGCHMASSKDIASHENPPAMVPDELTADMAGTDFRCQTC
jgi:hypothetical protein